MEGCPKPLEMIFIKLEEESELRAQEEQARQKATELSNKSTSANKTRDRRRGSVSISRIGKLSEDDLVSTPQGPPTPSIVAITANAPFYQAQIANGSTNSIASGASAHSDDHAHSEDDNHVTQMHHIAGKQSISSKMMPRRLSRSQSASVMPTRTITNVEPNVIIGVSIQEATIKSAPEDGDLPVITVSRRASVQASGSLRTKASRSTLAGSKPTNIGWLAKAKGFTMKFRRKTKASIS